MNASVLRLFSVVAIITVALPMSAYANAPGGRYVVTAGGTVYGTVYDTKTKLTWQQATLSTTYAWTDAKTYCASVGASLGGTGWRLPTIKELVSIVDYSQVVAPTIDTNAFPGTPAAYFWASSSVAGLASTAWYVHFTNAYAYYIDISNLYNVRCVR